MLYIDRTAESSAELVLRSSTAPRAFSMSAGFRPTPVTWPVTAVACLDVTSMSYCLHVHVDVRAGLHAQLTLARRRRRGERVDEGLCTFTRTLPLRVIFFVPVCSQALCCCVCGLFS